MRRAFLALLPLLILPVACASSSGPSASVPATAPATQAAEESSAGSADWWRIHTTVLQGDASFHEAVYTVTRPRADLWVQTEDGEIPTAAGIESAFHFFRCSCGRASVVGQFVVADYEANDVIDALRAGDIRIAGMGPMLMYEKPRLLMIHFQATGDIDAMVKTLKSALDNTGEARSSTQPSP